jgi:molecular chaperone DnaK
MGKVIGIDLGTTFSAVAYVNDHGRPEILPNREGERITPSVVLFDGENPIVGSIAKRSAVASPQSVVEFIKRQMGDLSWKFETDDGTEYCPESISALILKRLREDAEAILGESVTEAVITVPAYFNDTQRKATRDAGKIAGLNVLCIINEPTAAGLAYGLEKAGKPETVLVYDLGGGTFDVTLMRVDKGTIDVIATDGNRNLGGFDWDNALMEFLNGEFQRAGGANLFDDPSLEQDLRAKAEIAKKTLSSLNRTTVFLSAGGVSKSVTLTLEQFNEMTKHLLNRTAHLLEAVLEEAGLSWPEVEKILLVGGSTRMRAVPALVEKVTGKKPSVELHPDEVVALGAAIQGAGLKREDGTHGSKAYPLVEISDVISHSLGVIVLNEDGEETNSIILPRQTKVPCENTELYSTIVDRQREISLQVTQGEGDDPRDVEIIGDYPFPIPSYPKGAPIAVSFRFDENQFVLVKVTDVTAGKVVYSAEVKTKKSRTEDQVEEMGSAIARVQVA